MLLKEIKKNAGILLENKSTKVKAALTGVKVKGKKIASFGIISPENAMGKPMSSKENLERVKLFKEDLKKSRYQYKKVQGMYGVKENSFFIYNVDLGYLKNIASLKRFNQESFIYAENKEDGLTFYYYSKVNENSPHKKTDSINKIKNEKDAENFFTKHKSFKFNIPFKTLMENAEEEISEKFDYIDDDVFNEAMRYNREENKTLKHLWTKRCFLYETLENKAKRLKRISE